MNDRVSRWVARLLAHPAGFVVFNAFTVAWFGLSIALPWWLGGVRVALAALLISLPAYLDVVTWFSSATQFTLAYQNERAGRALDDALDRIERQTVLLVRFAENEGDVQQAVIAQGEAVVAALTSLQAHIAATTPKPRRRTP